MGYSLSLDDIRGYRARAVLYTACPRFLNGRAEEHPIYWDDALTGWVDKRLERLTKVVTVTAGSVASHLSDRFPDDANRKSRAAALLATTTDDIEKTPLVDVLAALDGTDVFHDFASQYVADAMRKAADQIRSCVPDHAVDRYALQLAEEAQASELNVGNHQGRTVGLRFTSSYTGHHMVMGFKHPGVGGEFAHMRIIALGKGKTNMEPAVLAFSRNILPVVEKNHRDYFTSIPRGSFGSLSAEMNETRRVLVA